MVCRMNRCLRVRALPLVLLSLVAGVGLAGQATFSPLGNAVAASRPEREPDVRAALLDGVKTIAAPGVPGTICVWGPRAFVVVVGKDDGLQVPVVAAGEQGKGRVVLFSHSSYVHGESLKVGETARLMANAVRWAGGKGDAVRVGVVGSKELTASLTQAGMKASDLDRDWVKGLEASDVLVLAGGLNEKQVAAVQAFISAGGGFITAQTGWGWRQNSGEKELIDFAVNHAVAGTGLAFGEGYAEKTSPEGFDTAVAPLALTHGGAALDALLGEAEGQGGAVGGDADGKKLKGKEAKLAASSAMQTLRVLPRDDTRFRPRLQKLLGARGDALAPTPEHPMKARDAAVDRFLLAYQFDQIKSLPPGQVKAHPAAAGFPGAVPADAKTVTRTVSIDTRIPEWHSLGLYAAPGATIEVTVPTNAAGAKLGVIIGAHRDELWHMDEWKRVPSISREFAIKGEKTAAANAFGGLVYIDVPGNCSLGEIQVTVSGAVEAPLFELGKTSASEWKRTIRHAPGPWAELGTGTVIVTVPSERIRELEDPTAVLEFWDKVLDAAADLATIPRERARPERYLADVQISAGYMHSGYPIMTHLDAGAWLASLDELRKGNWGLYHELGHNHQDDLWTFDGTTEVTCNLFCLYIHDTVCEGSKTNSKAWLAERSADVAKYFAAGAKFETWKSEPFTALAMYIQMQQAFGWETFKKVFAEYRALPAAERPRNDDQKRDQWMVRFSRACGRNLGPFFVAWGVPTSQAARDEVASLPGWMPEGIPPQR